MNPAIREAIEKADQSCPDREMELGYWCVSGIRHFRTIQDTEPCPWKLHAAIRNLARTVLEAAATRLEETADCMTSQDSRRSRSDLRGVAIVIRALMPEEVKQHE